MTLLPDCPASHVQTVPKANEALSPFPTETHSFPSSALSLDCPCYCSNSPPLLCPRLALAFRLSLDLSVGLGVPTAVTTAMVPLLMSVVEKAAVVLLVSNMCPPSRPKTWGQRLGGWHGHRWAVCPEQRPDAIRIGLGPHCVSSQLICPLLLLTVSGEQIRQGQGAEPPN